MFKNCKYSLSDITGADYAERVIAANAFLGNFNEGEARALMNEKVEFFPEDIQKKNDTLLTSVGKTVLSPMKDTCEGAPTDAFRRACDRAAAPVGGRGCFRVGEDGRLYLLGKSEHYHASLGHAFPGYRLVDIARRLGIPNATHNNTRGYITRLCERAIVAAANGTTYDEAATDAVIASREPHVPNRVINLETGSLAVEAGVKMMLARFYRLSPELPEPKYSGKIPVFLVMADHSGGPDGNYHGTTVLTQTFRGLWGDLAARAAEGKLWLTVPVAINDTADFAAKIEKYNTGEYKTAGFLHEIIMMNYGGLRLSEEYLREAYRLCRGSDTPTLVDEIQTGMWYGGLFLFRKYGLNPDFAVIGKGFPGGEFPASRIITSAEYDNLNQFGALVTNGQEELASLSYLITMRFALDNADEIDRVGALFSDGMANLCCRHGDKLVAAEGMGHLAALHFATVDEAAALTRRLHAACIDASAQLYKPDCVPAVLFKPPLIMSEATVGKIIGVLDNILSGEM